MADNRRNFMKSLVTGAVGGLVLSAPDGAAAQKQEQLTARTIPIALVQFDAVPEQVDRNLREMERLAEQAAKSGARWVMFHEGTVCDYTPRLREFAEQVPEGKCTQWVTKMASRLNCFISFGLSETRADRFHISQVFVGPQGFLYRYRKTWIWHDPKDEGYRDEWVRYDPGMGPEIFQFDGLRATCFICADGLARRCIDRAAELRPQLVFYPNNRSSLYAYGPDLGQLAKMFGAPLLVSNRVGISWFEKCEGGCVVYGSHGEVLAKANCEGKEEILLCNLEIRPKS
jgi:predicted amidohydrolase